MQNIAYIGYKENKKIGTTFVPIVVPLGEPVSTAIASAVATAAGTIAASFKDWRLFQGHSEWYLWDQDLRNKNYADLVAITAKWYKDGGINNKNLLEAASDQIPAYRGTPRFKLLPLIYAAYPNNFIGLLIAEYANMGALPQSAVPAGVTIQTQSVQNPLLPASSTTSATSSTQTAGISPIMLFVLLGAGLFLISKKSK